jgi:hypothetical protein
LIARETDRQKQTDSGKERERERLFEHKSLQASKVSLYFIYIIHRFECVCVYNIYMYVLYIIRRSSVCLYNIYMYVLYIDR